MPEMLEFTEDQLKGVVKERVDAGLKAIEESIPGVVSEAVKAVLAENAEGDEGVKGPRVEGGTDRLSYDPMGGYKGGIVSFGYDIYKAATTKVLPERLQNWIKAARTNDDLRELTREEKTLSTIVDDEGATLIPPGISSGIFQPITESNPIMTRVTEFPLSTNSQEFKYVEGFDQSGNLIGGGVVFYWTEEKGTITASEPKFGSFTLKLKKLAAMCKVTNELLEDNPFAIEPFLTSLYSNGINYTLMRAFLNGNGVGQPMGILNAPCMLEVPKETGQSADTIQYKNVLRMNSRKFDDEGSNSSDLWMANKDTMTEIGTMYIGAGAAGVPVWSPPTEGNNGPYFGSIFGMPFVWSKHCKTLGDKGDIVLANWRHYYVAMKGGMKAAQSMHLYFDSDEHAFRWTFRIDGAPSWPAAFQPSESAETQSPFVTLAERA